MYLSHVYLVTGAADDGGEHGPGGIVSGKASLHQPGAVVAHKGGSLIVVTHGGFYKRQEDVQEFIPVTQKYSILDRRAFLVKARLIPKATLTRLHITLHVFLARINK